MGRLLISMQILMFTRLAAAPDVGRGGSRENDHHHHHHHHHQCPPLSLSVSVCLSVSAGKLIPIFAHTSGQQSDENVRGGSELNHSKAK